MLTLGAALPVWRQSTITLPDGSHDAQWFNDCGETSLAAILAAVKGTPINPGSIRANLGGPARSGLTSSSDLVRIAGYYNLKCHSEFPIASQVQGWLLNWSRMQRPSIVLGTWPTPGGVLHWMYTYAADDSWWYINPWSGQRSWLSWADTEKYYGGEVVACDSPVQYWMSHVAMPY